MTRIEYLETRLALTRKVLAGFKSHLEVAYLDINFLSADQEEVDYFLDHYKFEALHKNIAETEAMISEMTEQLKIEKAKNSTFKTQNHGKY